MKFNTYANTEKGGDIEELKKKGGENEENKGKEHGKADTSEDMVSGFLYERLQKEVINLRKACEAGDTALNAKDEEIKMLMKKVDALTKSIEVETKKAKREAAAREKEPIDIKRFKTQASLNAEYLLYLEELLHQTEGD